jgi:hypothetical protein
MLGAGWLNPWFVILLSRLPVVTISLVGDLAVSRGYIGAVNHYRMPHD